MVVYDSYDHGSGRAALDAVAGLGDRWWKLDSRIDLVSARVLALFGIICSSKRFFTKLTSDGCCSTIEWWLKVAHAYAVWGGWRERESNPAKITDLSGVGQLVHGRCV